jgi:hypothetical protein
MEGSLLGKPVRVATVGVELFAGELERLGVDVSRVEWRPPVPGSEAALQALAVRAEQMWAANDLAVERLQAAHPVVTGIGSARDLIDGMGPATFLHAGPPIEWPDMSGPLRGAVLGAAVYEGLADNLEEAERMADVKVFHAGTMLRSDPSLGRDGRIATDGGRVLDVTALGATLAEAQARAYEAARSIRFAGGWYRRDIAERAIKRPR